MGELTNAVKVAFSETDYRNLIFKKLHYKFNLEDNPILDTYFKIASQK
jgi:hypothetical protein